jgi:hypothetical protein
MKKPIVLLAFFLGLTTVFSCKKDRTCECTDTQVSATSDDPKFVFTPSKPQTYSITYKKIKKNSTLLNSCVSSESAISEKETFFNGTTTVEYTYTYSSKLECKIK